MLWSDLIGHKQQLEWFRTALASGRLASSFLFVGPAGIGKRTFARLLAKSMLCRHGQGESLAPCGECEDCAQVEASTHPDLIQISKPPDRAFIPIELLIGEREKRMREGLCHDISMRPYSGRRKIAILDDADALNVEGANALLKTLEEPPSDSLLILIGTSLQRQLPTIRSRCQAIIFRPLQDEQLAELLMRNAIVSSPSEAEELSRMSGGSLSEAFLFNDPELRSFRASLLNLLAAPKLPMSEFAKSCGGLVDAVGKDAKARRERLKLILRMAAAFYREMAIGESTGKAASQLNGKHPGDKLIAIATAAARSHWKYGPRAASGCWNRCLLAIEQVDRNANQASLLESLAADLASTSGC